MNAALTLWNKHMHKSMSNPEEAIGMLIQPVLWVVLFGVGMGSLLGATNQVQRTPTSPSCFPASSP